MTESRKPKLIEVALPLAEISEASSKEKSVKHGHPANLHMWWARRPLAAARAVIWASFVDDPSGHPERFPTADEQAKERERLFDILIRLVPWEASDDESVLTEARAEIEKCFEGEPPPILDPFAGGGAIPLEAQRLGLLSLSGDLNPVAVLVQRAMLEIPPRVAGLRPVFPGSDSALATWSGLQGLAADVQAYGEWMIKAAESQIGGQYPRVPNPDGGADLTPLAWIWARTVESPDPAWSGHVPLVKSWVLAKKPKRPLVWVQPVVDHATQSISYRIRTGGTPAPGTTGRGQATCVATGTAISGEYIKAEAVAGRMSQKLIAIVAEGDRTRVFLEPDSASELAAQVASPADAPTGLMSTHPQYMGTPRYGLDHWHKLFTPRQLTALTTFSNVLPELWSKVESDARAAGLAADGRLRDGGAGAAAYADAVVTYLAFALDKLADLNNSLAAWEPVAQCPRHLFGRQSVSMVWDFAEANPFSTSSGSFKVLLDGLRKVLEGRGFSAAGRMPAVRLVEQRDATARVKEVGTCSVCTDPPYYAQVPYADISDFFYVWMRRNLSEIWPDECATLLTPKAEELVADEKRHGSKAAAAKFFEEGMFRVFSAVAEAQDERLPATVFYAFKQAEENDEGQTSTGWETFLQGLLDSGLAITSTWPIRTENKSRLRAMTSNALASSVVLSCRPRLAKAALETRGGFIEALRAELPAAVRVLQQENIAPVDLAQSAIGPGMRVFSRYAKVVEADGSTMKVRAALSLINEVLGEVLSEEESELDADSRFALTWFEQFGHNPGPYGDADVLARAKDTSVAGVVESGIAISRDGKLRLLERHELPPEWSPVTDSRATVWEATQHLIRRLAEAESEASELLSQLGGVADRARQLAYLLFGVCERKGRTDDAIAYNGLITAWPELTRLAGTTSAGPDQQTLL